MDRKHSIGNGYLLAFAGAITGAVVLFAGFSFLAVIIGLLTMNRLPPGSGYLIGGLFLWGQLIGVVIGAAVGIAGALATGQHEAPVLTGLLSIPAAVLVFFAVFGMGQIVDTMDYGWLLIAPPLAVPFLARRTALWLKFGSRPRRPT